MLSLSYDYIYLLISFKVLAIITYQVFCHCEQAWLDLAKNINNKLVRIEISYKYWKIEPWSKEMVKAGQKKLNI